MCSIWGVVLCGKQSEDSWQKKVDYQEGLEKSHADSAARSCNSYMKDLEKSPARSCENYIKDPEKSHADSAAQNRDGYKKNLKSHDDSSVRSHESYLKDPEKGREQNHECYMKDPEKSRADSAARNPKSYKKDLKSHWNETGLAISYKSKNTAAT